MITYATTDDFLEMKDIGKSGIIVVSNSSVNKIDVYLERATRYIDKATRRYFAPRYETRQYSVPYAVHDLAMRRYPSSHLGLDMDLLEVVTLDTGQGIIDSDGYFLLEHNLYPKNIIALNPPNYWGGGYGGGSIGRYDSPVLLVTGFWGYADYGYPYEFWVDTAATIEAGGITATQTVLTVTDATIEDDLGHTSFEQGRLLRVDNELMEIIVVNDPAANNVTVRRGVRGTIKVAHDEGTTITKWRVEEDIQEVCLQVAKTWREADIAAGGRIGVSDVSPGAELSIPTDPQEILRSYHRSMLNG